MKQTKTWLSALIISGLVGFSTGVLASAGHGHDEGGAEEKHHEDSDGHHDNDHDQDHDKGHDKDAMFVKKKEIDGYTVSFHIMKAKEGKSHGGTHNFMLKVEQDGRILTDITVNSKVVHPNGSAQTSKLSRMGDWYMTGYDLGHEGEHQVMVLFKTADGEKHKGGVHY